MDPEKSVEQEDFMIEQQLFLYQNQLPEVPRGESDNFFKEINRDERHGITYIQIGFLVANLSPSIYDLASVIINDIHCVSEDNLKLIIDDDQLWATSTIPYPFHSIGDLNYNIIESNLRESLQKTREILQEILEAAREGNQKCKSDQQIMKEARSKYRNIHKSFKDPNSDY